MSTKDQILSFLENNRGAYYSGEQLAEELGVSRTSVWKAVKTLQSAGYPIDAVTNKGYCLAEDADILSTQGVVRYLENTDALVEVIPITSSTNTLVKERASEGAPEGLVIVSNEQTAGRGRSGRSFYSPKDTGLYISLLLRPDNFHAEQATRITTMAAVAMCQAIEAVSDAKAQIKWVNDIFVNEKKVCGILTEGSFSMESGMLEYAVLGLGINVYPPEGGFPEEIQAIAGTVLPRKTTDAKNKLCGEFIKSFFKLYRSANSTAYVSEYKERCFIIGREVNILQGETSTRALVTGVDDDCHLQVRFPDGNEETFMSGEISLRI